MILFEDGTVFEKESFAAHGRPIGRFDLPAQRGARAASYWNEERNGWNHSVCGDYFPALSEEDKKREMIMRASDLDDWHQDQFERYGSADSEKGRAFLSAHLKAHNDFLATKGMAPQPDSFNVSVSGSVR